MRITCKHRNEFLKNGWTQVDMGLSNEQINNFRVGVEKLKERMQLIEHAKSQSCDNVAAASMHSKFDFHASLAATTQTVDRLRDEISTKAGYEDTRIALSLLEREVVKLGETTVEQSQLETILRSKIDRNDLSQIAALVANGNFDGINSQVTQTWTRNTRFVLLRLETRLSSQIGCCETPKSPIALPLL